LIYSRRLKFVFIHIPKTAGDSVANALRPYLGWSDVLIENDFQAWIRRLPRRTDRNLYILGKHATASQVREMLPEDIWGRSLRATFVRHPFERAVSLYRYSARKSTERARLGLRNAWYLTPAGRGEEDPKNWPAVQAYREASSFSEFIRHPLTLKDQAMRPQTEFLYDDGGRLLIDFIGRFERLQDDFGCLSSKLGIPRTELGRRNISQPEQRPFTISGSDRVYLKHIYEQDFRAFGYTGD
jgi:hypothetical protein